MPRLQNFPPTRIQTLRKERILRFCRRYGSELGATAPRKTGYLKKLLANVDVPVGVTPSCHMRRHAGGVRLRRGRSCSRDRPALCTFEGGATARDAFTSGQSRRSLQQIERNPVIIRRDGRMQGGWSLWLGMLRMTLAGFSGPPSWIIRRAASGILRFCWGWRVSTERGGAADRTSGRKTTRTTRKCGGSCGVTPFGRARRRSGR